jgi:hypothetical protein
MSGARAVGEALRKQAELDERDLSPAAKAYDPSDPATDWRVKGFQSPGP